VNRSLKITLAAAALQLALALDAAGQTTPIRASLPADQRAAAGARRTPMSQRSGPRRRRAGDALAAGVWGGEHIRFEVTEHGANVEYDCAHGTVEGRIVVDSRGRFNVAGTHVEEHGGPVRADESEEGYPVRLSGRVGGSLMKLTVTRAGTRKVIGVFTLARDREAGLVKCR
jgi:hypothetical protein